MSRNKTTVRLRHMLDHAREAVSLTQGKSRVDIDNDYLIFHQNFISDKIKEKG